MAVRSNPNRKFEELRLAAVTARMPFEREAWLNLAFYLNEQYVKWAAARDSDPGTLMRIPREQGRKTPRPVVNKIMHYVRQAHAEALQDQPVGDVLPATDDYVDLSDAQVAKAYVDYVGDETVADYDSALSRAALWAIIAGTGWQKWCWSPNEKQAEIMAPSFFEVFADPYAKDAKRMRYVIHSQFMDVEQVYEAWGKELPANRVEQADLLKTELMRGMGAAPVISGVTVHELWMKPSRRHPKGLYTVWAGSEQLVPPGDLPYEHARLPFTPLGCIERPDTLYCMSPVTYLRSAQMELNKYHAQRIMIRQAFAAPKWWIPTELELQRDPDDSPSQILRGNSQSGMVEPKIISPQTYPPNDDGEMIEQQMMHIVGQHEVSQAQVPGRVEAAKAIELLKEADANALSYLRKTIKRSHSEGWYQVLRLAQQYEEEQKMVQAYSREGVPEVKAFRAKALKPGFRVKTTMTTGLARSRAAKQDLLLRLWELKVIQDPELVAELMEVPVPTLLSHRAADIRLARNENIEIAKGDNAVQANSWDDHAIHLREHNAFRKTTEFMMLDTEVKQKFEFHCQQHEQLQKQQLAKQAELAMILQGGPPQPGGTESATTNPQEGTVPSDGAQPQ